MKITPRNPVDLRMHPLRKLLPPPAKERIDRIADAIQAGVPLPPIYIVEPNLVVAGWTRALAHRQMQRDVECCAITEAEAMTVALGENTNRQIYPFKYQVAWVYCPLAARAVERAAEVSLQNLKQGKSPMFSREASGGLSGTGPATLAEVADLIGVSRTKLVEVKECYDRMLAWDQANEPRSWNGGKQKCSAMEFWTGRILDDEKPCTPGNAMAGIGGRTAADAGKTKPAPKQLELFCEGMASIAKWGRNFDKFVEADHRQAVKAVRTTVAAWPATLRAEVLAEIKRLDREEREGK